VRAAAGDSGVLYYSPPGPLRQPNSPMTRRQSFRRAKNNVASNPGAYGRRFSGVVKAWRADKIRQTLIFFEKPSTLTFNPNDRHLPLQRSPLRLPKSEQLLSRSSSWIQTKSTQEQTGPLRSNPVSSRGRPPYEKRIEFSHWVQASADFSKKKRESESVELVGCGSAAAQENCATVLLLQSFGIGIPTLRMPITFEGMKCHACSPRNASLVNAAPVSDRRQVDAPT